MAVSKDGPPTVGTPVHAAVAIAHGSIVLWDAGRLEAQPDAALFDVEDWRGRGRVVREAEGRGAAHFLRATDHETWVLRHYRRGGLISHINHDRYLWSGAQSTRAAREFRLLTALYNRGLAVPRPVAARAVRRPGWMYTADLLTQAIPGTRPLAEHLAYARLDETGWRRLGAVVAELHRAGVWHADLNARNVLIDEQGRFHLLDFDRARFRGAGRWRQANLARLRRSLDKFAARHAGFNFVEDDWCALGEGYRLAFDGL